MLQLVQNNYVDVLVWDVTADIHIINTVIDNMKKCRG